MRFGASVIRNKIGVVTVTYNSGSVLREFLDSLAAQTWSSLTLYAIDNSSRDDSVELLRQCTGIPVVVIENHTNVGIAEGNNQGILAALKDGCESILLLNNDTVFPPDLLEKLRAGLDTYHCDITTPKMYYYDRPNVLWCAGGELSSWRAYYPTHYGANQTDTGQLDTARPVPFSPACCLLVRRSVFEQVGLMDSRYFVYVDDVDFLYRCQQRGCSLWYIPNARLWHKVSSLTGSVSDFILRYCTRNHVYFVRKHLPYPLALGLYLAVQLRSLLALVLLCNSWAKFLVRFRSAREGWQMAKQPSAAIG